jgi:hypothetical protein
MRTLHFNYHRVFNSYVKLTQIEQKVCFLDAEKEELFI